MLAIMAISGAFFLLIYRTIFECKHANSTVFSSQVYSADMWYSVFAKDPMNRKEGRRYRYTVLEKGGSVEEMHLLKNFLGREPNPDAFYRELVKS